MADLRLISPPPRDELLEQLRGRLGHAVPGSSLVAENVLGADATIDFVVLEPGGRIALILVGEHEEDLELVGRGLAQRAWVEARLPDWSQLALHLEIRPDAAVRVVLLCPNYEPETRAAIQALGPDTMAALLYRCVQNGGSCEVLLEHLLLPEIDRPTAAAGAVEASPPAQFRTGLNDADLDLTHAERREFE